MDLKIKDNDILFKDDEIIIKTKSNIKVLQEYNQLNKKGDAKLSDDVEDLKKEIYKISKFKISIKDEIKEDIKIIYDKLNSLLKIESVDYIIDLKNRLENLLEDSSKINSKQSERLMYLEELININNQKVSTLEAYINSFRDKFSMIIKEK